METYVRPNFQFSLNLCLPLGQWNTRKSSTFWMPISAQISTNESIKQQTSEKIEETFLLTWITLGWGLVSSVFLSSYLSSIRISWRSRWISGIHAPASPVKGATAAESNWHTEIVPEKDTPFTVPLHTTSMRDSVGGATWSSMALRWALRHLHGLCWVTQLQKLCSLTEHEATFVLSNNVMIARGLYTLCSSLFFVPMVE